jgi:myo-inositol 2-dehydrogenase / D-chiro-inositol 1-dehydrogenase
MTKLRYGLIGAGMMGREHLRNIALLKGATVTAIADPDVGSRNESARAVQGLFGKAPSIYRDHRDLLDKGEVDALVIASPNDTHRAVLKDAFQAKRALPILVEKPVCTSARDVEALREAGAKHPAPVWVAMEYRYMPPVQELMKEIGKGRIGDLRMLAIREHRFPFLEKVGDWNRFSRRTGGTLVEKCCHFFDLMRLIMRNGDDSDEPIRVFASGAMDVNHRDESYGGETPDILDNAFVIVDFRSGRRAALDLCMFAEGAYWQETIAATGDKGRAEIFIPGPARFWPGGAERHSEIEISPRKPKGPKRRAIAVDEAILKAGDHHGSTFYQHQGFQRAVARGATVEVTLEDGLKAVMVGLAAERSAKTGKAVALAF